MKIKLELEVTEVQALFDYCAPLKYGQPLLIRQVVPKLLQALVNHNPLQKKLNAPEQSER